VRVEQVDALGGPQFDVLDVREHAKVLLEDFHLSLLPHAVFARAALVVHVDLLELVVFLLDEALAFADFVQVLLMVDQLGVGLDGLGSKLFLLVFVLPKEQHRLYDAAHLQVLQLFFAVLVVEVVHLCGVQFAPVQIGLRLARI